jgi:predicted methyltransferase
MRRVWTVWLWLVCVWPAAAHADAIDDALQNPQRREEDLDRDPRSKPKEVLSFFGVKPGMTVVDLFAGSGYYTEIIARVVGPRGKVYLHNNAEYLNFVGKDVEQRLAGGRLPNVQRLDAEIGELGMEDASVDMVIMVMTYHDIYYTADSWSIDPISFFGEVRAMMKPGGILGIVDHSAQPGTGNHVVQTLHRIDEKFAVDDIVSRGFEFKGALDVLRNPADDRTVNVFEPAVRGKTDQFVLKFTKK